MSQPPLQLDVAVSPVADNMAVHIAMKASCCGHCFTWSFHFQLEPEHGGYQLPPDMTRAEQQDVKMLETEVREHPFS